MKYFVIIGLSSVGVFLVLFNIYTNLVWIWLRKHDGSDGKWPWYIRLEFKNELNGLPPEKHLEFFRLMHERLK